VWAALQQQFADPSSPLRRGLVTSRMSLQSQQVAQPAVDDEAAEAEVEHVVDAAAAQPGSPSSSGPAGLAALPALLLGGGVCVLTLVAVVLVVVRRRAAQAAAAKDGVDHLLAAPFDAAHA
jgi:hypothetical protein